MGQPIVTNVCTDRFIKKVNVRNRFKSSTTRDFAISLTAILHRVLEQSPTYAREEGMLLMSFFNFIFQKSLVLRLRLVGTRIFICPVTSAIDLVKSIMDCYAQFIVI